MISRDLQKIAEQALKSFPAVALLGPRQVGKTTLSKLILKKQKKKSHTIDLEYSSDFQRLRFEPEHYLSAYRDYCILIDEIQRLPGLFPSLRYLIDQKRIPGRFIVTGSASPTLLKGATESLAGRIIYLALNPISCIEIISPISIKKHWLRGGFPLALTRKSDKLWFSWMHAFITSYIERDLAFLFDARVSTIVIRKLWTMLAHQQGSILNAENLGNALDISGPTVKRYLDFLEGAFMVFRLQPYFVNIGKRLVKSPKVYINDSGILHCLLGIQNELDLLNHPIVGFSWEGYVFSQIRYSCSNSINQYYYRTQVGAEIDLVLVKANKVIACIEIKFSAAPSISRGFYQGIQDLKSPANFVICLTEIDYKNEQGIRILGLQQFIKSYLKKFN